MKGLNSINPTFQNWTGRENNTVVITFLPGKWTSMNSFQMLDSIVFTVTLSEDLRQRSNPPIFASNSILQSIPTYKISTTDAGIYKIDNQLLSDLGISTSGLNPRNIHIYSTNAGSLPELNSEPRIDDLAEIAVFIEGENDDRWDPSDYILFYSPGSHKGLQRY
jgi:hypothetical protein